MQLFSVGLLLARLTIPPALTDELFALKTQLFRFGLLPFSLYIPAPTFALFPVKMQLFRFGLLALLYIPPPLATAMLALKMQLLTVGLLPNSLSIPAPLPVVEL